MTTSETGIVLKLDGFNDKLAVSTRLNLMSWVTNYCDLNFGAKFQHYFVLSHLKLQNCRGNVPYVSMPSQILRRPRSFAVPSLQRPRTSESQADQEGFNRYFVEKFRNLRT